MMKFEADTAYQVPPGTLLLERNIRESKPSPELVQSVADLGVLEPITAVLNADGGLLVRFGHRRVLAAIEAKRDTVPVYVAGVDDTAAAAEVDRVIRQRDENTHRENLTAAEEVGVVEQLVAFGLSADQVVQQARVKRENVDAAIRVSSSKLARKAAAKYADLALDHAAAVVEFEDDPKTAQVLLVTALDRPHQFAHELQRHRDDRARAAAKAAATAKLTEAGVTVVDAPSWDHKTKRLSRLVDPANPEKPLTATKHKKCPGHVAWVVNARADGNADAEYGCTDPAKHGHRDTYSMGSSSKPAAADLTEAEREKAKKARKLVIDNNKAWASAETVRRAWLKILAKNGKTAPKGAAAFIATAVTLDSGQFGYDTTPADLMTEWLGVKREHRGDLTKTVAGVSDARALVLALAHVLAVYEANLTQQSWRVDGTTSAAGRYLRFLETCGYALSDVEKYAISSRTA